MGILTPSVSPGAAQRRGFSGGSATMKDLRTEEHQVVVALRIRPINETELEEGATVIGHRVREQIVVLMDPMEDPEDILRANRSREKTFIFDMVFGPQATQEEVYLSTTKSLIEGVVSGYNATVFAYGPTGAGKTYTMLGTDSEPGIYIRTLHDLFQAIEATGDDQNYLVCMSYLEVYNEIIRDLLNPSTGYLELREDSKGCIQIAGITEVSTTNAQEIMQLLTKGNKERTQEPTAANKTSSRSHAVLQVSVKQTNRMKGIGEEVRVGRLFMVDLAGSERAAQTQNQGKRRKEGAHINRSLLALGNCINALSEKGSSRTQYINFRDSKLTRLLKDSLGGNSRTVMIAHISPASSCFEESRTTLMYAYRAKNIKTRVKRNLLNVSYHIAQYTSIISNLRREIECLKAKVENQEKHLLSPGAKDGQAQGESPLDLEEDGHQLQKLRKQLVGAFKEQMDMRRSLMELENTNMELHVDTSRHLLLIADWERERVRQGGQTANTHHPSEKEDEEADQEDFLEPVEIAIAREEINTLVAEQRKTAALKADLEQRLANAKKKVSQMEKLLPEQTTSKDQREVLSLLCKTHELEVGKTELQANALYKDNLLCQKDFIIQRHQQYRHLCEELIQQQWSLIKDHNIPVLGPLEKLYRLYFHELEEGTLDRLMVLHSLMSNAWQFHSGQIPRQDRNREENPEGSVDHKKASLPGPKFELPPIVVDSDSDSYRSSSKNTPAKRKVTREWNHTPNLFHLLTPVHQKKTSGIPSQKVASKLRSPSSQDFGRKNSRPDALNGLLTLKTLKEMVDSTKKIALIATHRRSQVQEKDLGRKVSSAQYFGEEKVESQQPSFTPEHRSKGTATINGLGGMFQRKVWTHHQVQNEGDEETSWERKTEKQGPLEPTSSKILQMKHWSPSSQDSNGPGNQMPPTKTPDGSVGNLSHIFPVPTKLKFPVGHQTEENPPQVLIVNHMGPSTIQQSNSNQPRGQVLQKQVKGQSGKLKANERSHLQ
ncbi:kinesin-like protein KIF19 [Pantherophis guttatus]|uniref:Kinesin-like protein n=1 Tax=Pantherophis guttatus TaxID=94885 RepID=A0ABM3YV37_PANGU|nr:kinesin-like protein KIF19 [Pantherophis guttatus]